MNNSNPIYLTKEGLENLKIELQQLIDVERSEVAKRIKSARDMGDTSENAEYSAARERQSFVEGRISELQDIIKNAVVENSTDLSKISVGHKVTLHIEGDHEEFHIVGATEADPSLKKISYESALGASLLGKKVGDEIEVEVPVGKLTYRIVDIK